MEIDDKVLISQFLNYKLLERGYFTKHYGSSGEIDFIKTASIVACDSQGNMLTNDSGEPCEEFIDINFKTYDKLIGIMHYIESLKFPSVTTLLHCNHIL